MKILVLPSFYPDSSNTNIGSFFKEQVKTLAKFGIEVNVIYVEQKSLRKFGLRNLKGSYFQSSVIDEINWKEYRIKGWNMPGRIGEKLWIYLSKKLVKRFILENGAPDLIHCHNAFCAGEVCFNINKQFNIPYLITEHDNEFFHPLRYRKKIIAKQVFKKAAQIIVVSESLKKAINKIERNLKIDIIPNIVDTDFFIPNDLNSENNTVNFLSIGSLDKNKAHDLLIEAFYLASKMRPNIILNICGDGPERKNLMKKINHLNLDKRVKLIGHVDKVEILKWLQKSDCLVHPSYFETFGVVLIEAMSCGIPFISSKSGGPNDIYQEGVGFMVDPGNVTTLRDAMLEFVNVKNTFSKSKIRSIAVKKYSCRAVFEKLIRLYSNVLDTDSKIEV